MFFKLPLLFYPVFKNKRIIFAKLLPLTISLMLIFNFIFVVCLMINFLSDQQCSDRLNKVLQLREILQGILGFREVPVVRGMIKEEVYYYFQFMIMVITPLLFKQRGLSILTDLIIIFVLWIVFSYKFFNFFLPYLFQLK